MAGPAVTEMFRVTWTTGNVSSARRESDAQLLTWLSACDVCTWRSRRRRPPGGEPVSGVRADAQAPDAAPTNAVYGWRDLGNVLFFPIVFSIFCREPVVFLYLKEN